MDELNRNDGIMVPEAAAEDTSATAQQTTAQAAPAPQAAPSGDFAAQAAPAPQAAVQAAEAPAPQAAQAAAYAPEPTPSPVPASAAEESKFTPEEQAKIDQFASTINIKDTAAVLQYGSGAQQKLAEFSESALASVKTKELGEVGELLTDLVTEIKTSGEEKKGIFGGLFQNAEKKLEQKKAQYAESEKNIDKIADALEDHQIILMKDIATLDKLYEKNHLYFKEISMYIEAGKKRLQEVREGELAQLRAKAETSKLPEDVQALDDLNNRCERFEKKIYDLELTRTVALQMAPQIRMVQNNDTLMSEKIQSTLVNALPLWKSQMLIALGLAHSQEAAKVQQMVTDATNQMLIQNAEALKDATVSSAREYERGIIDMDTLKKTNESLITTIDEVIKIQDEGRAQRREAEAELVRLEDELRNKIIASATRSAASADAANRPSAPAAPSQASAVSQDDPFGLFS